MGNKNRNRKDQSVSTNKQISSTEALETTPGLAPQVTPANNNMKAPEQTNEPIIVNNIVMRTVDRTPKDVGRWRDDHKMAESIYFPQRSRLYDLYMDVILDGHLSGLIMKRIDSVLNKKFRYVKNNQEVDEVCKLIQTNIFRKLIRELMLSIFWGASGFEFLPGGSFDFKEIPRKHIKPEKKVIAINQTDYVGIPYEDISNVWVVGEDRDLGLLLKAAFYVLLKKGSFSDWANYVEVFGQPVMVTRYDTYDDQTQKQLKMMMDQAAASLKISIPKNADFEIIDGKTSNGNGDLQNKFVNACNEELSVLILGNTETTKSSNTSGYAQSNTHQTQQNQITKSDVHFVRNLLNSDKFKNILSSYNLPIEGGEFMVEEEVDVNELQIKAQVLMQLKQSYNLPISDDYLYEEFNIPRPDNYDELKEKQEAASQVVPPDPNEEEPTDPVNPAPPGNKKQAPGNKKPAAKNLTAWERFRATMADFFAQAHND